MKNKLPDVDLSKLNSTQLQFLRAEKEGKLGLYAAHAPHLFKHKFYSWSRKIFESENKHIFFTAGNQLGKSTVMIMKNIDWATDNAKKPKRWPRAYSNRNEANVFWYFYPTKDLVRDEVDLKWKPFLITNGARSNSPYFCELVKSPGSYSRINFINANTSIIFKTYEQSRDSLQASSVYHITLDEEPKLGEGHKNIMGEIFARLSATDGYLMAGFTATHAQEYFYRIMEVRDEKDKAGNVVKKRGELFPDALKDQISAYDCMYYEDGSPGAWPRSRIRAAEIRYENEPGQDHEVQKRIHGRFTKGVGLVYNSFNDDTNVTKNLKIGGDWQIFSGVDIGSGGDQSAAAITFLAMAPDGTQGKIIAGWKGPRNIETDSGRIWEEYKRLRSEIYQKYKRTPYSEFYDSASKDFAIVAARHGGYFIKANKKLDDGIELINTLFRTKTLFVCDIPELDDLRTEMKTYIHGSKAKRSNDFCDSMRYAVASIANRWKIPTLEDVAKGEEKSVKLEVTMGNHPDNIPGFYDEHDFGRLTRRDEFMVKNGWRPERPGGFKDNESYASKNISKYHEVLRNNYGIRQSGQGTGID